MVGVHASDQQGAIMSTIENPNDNITHLENAEHREDSLGAPSGPTSNALWIIVVLILGGVIFIGVWLGAVSDGSDETALYGFVGLASALRVRVRVRRRTAQPPAEQEVRRSACRL